MFRSFSVLFKIYFAPVRYLFDRKLYAPRVTQERLLRRLVRNLSKTEYGEKLNVSAKDSYDEFKSKVPIVSYEQIASLVEKHRVSNAKALTPEKILMFEKTSGSTGNVKYIPYTKSLLRSFNRMFVLWCHDILISGLSLRTGRIFMSVSPSFETDKKDGDSKQVGATSDLDYLSRWMAILMRQFLIVPTNVRRIKNPETYKFVVSLYLLSEEKLEIISVWSPTLIEMLFNYIEDNRESLLQAWRVGRFNAEGLKFKLKLPSKEREHLLMASPIEWNKLWPNLKLISCWSSANAKPFAMRLQAYFPLTILQGKGLLATEAPLTVPFIKYRQDVLLIDEVFFEFESSDGNILPLWEVKQGVKYKLIISQKSGLYRYRLGDMVIFIGFARRTPCFKFIGRDACSDLVGEKLNEEFVAERLDSIQFLAETERVLLPVVSEAGKAYYLLLCERCAIPVEEMAEILDRRLKSSFQYQCARDLQQLDAPKVQVTDDISLKYLTYMLGTGVSLGNIKTPSLITSPKQAQNFLGSIRPAH